MFICPYLLYLFCLIHFEHKTCSQLQKKEKKGNGKRKRKEKGKGKRKRKRKEKEKKKKMMTKTSSHQDFVNLIIFPKTSYGTKSCPVSPAFATTSSLLIIFLPSLSSYLFSSQGNQVLFLTFYDASLSNYFSLTDQAFGVAQ